MWPKYEWNNCRIELIKMRDFIFIFFLCRLRHHSLVLQMVMLGWDFFFIQTEAFFFFFCFRYFKTLNFNMHILMERHIWNIVVRTSTITKHQHSKRVDTTLIYVEIQIAWNPFSLSKKKKNGNFLSATTPIKTFWVIFFLF